MPEHLTSGEVFVALDRLLDSTRMGSVYLRQDKIARWANKLLGRVGKPFWQEECFDRLVHSASECKQIRRYIELNPVKAGLVAHPAEFPWSSAGGRESGSEDPRGLKSAVR